jgi:hypothetical protein
LAYQTALTMADNAILFKYAAKSIGMRYGIIPSFMAKPWGKVRTLIFSLFDLQMTHACDSCQDAAGQPDKLVFYLKTNPT